jgi:hypothetical protein
VRIITVQQPPIAVPQLPIAVQKPARHRAALSPDKGIAPYSNRDGIKRAGSRAETLRLYGSRLSSPMSSSTIDKILAAQHACNTPSGSGTSSTTPSVERPVQLPGMGNIFNMIQIQISLTSRYLGNTIVQRPSAALGELSTALWALLRWAEWVAAMLVRIHSLLNDSKELEEESRVRWLSLTVGICSQTLASSFRLVLRRLSRLPSPA